ncbi:MAG: OmpH family outer membrane protein [Dysgonomonas sp.]
MKNISYIINGVFAVAIIVLFILFFTSNKKNTEGDSTLLKFAEGDTTGVLPIAYINVDSLLHHYNLYNDSSEELLLEQKKINTIVDQKRKQLEGEYADFQKKVQNNAFLSQERYEQEGKRIQGLEASIQGQVQKLQADMYEKQDKMNNQISDSIRINVEDYNKKANYQLIFSNTPITKNIIVAKGSYDITKVIIAQMNSRYQKETVK